MSSQTDSGDEQVSIEHAIILDICDEGDGINIYFVSGDGIVIASDGEAKDPRFFAIKFYPENDFYKKVLIDELTDWKNNDDPVDVSIINSYSMLYNSKTECTIEIILDDI